MAGTHRFMAGLRGGVVPVCDACIALAVGWSRRQSTNAAGRALAAKGLILREKGTCARCGRAKTVSRPGAGERPASDRPWYRKADVQSAVADFLIARGYRLRSVGAAASRQRTSDLPVGPDILAERDGEILWVVVRGRPKGAEKTSAAHGRLWFSSAMLEVVRYRTEQPAISVGVGLPDRLPAYLDLLAEVAWLRAAVPFRFFWVADDGTVREE